MAIRLGATGSTGNYKVGSNQVSRMMLGSTLAWPTGDPNGTYPLDKTGQADLGLSVRRLSSTYTGFCMRVQRSSDDATQDIGFDGNGDLDTAAILAFCGTDIGTVNIWYDQSGHGYDLSGGGLKICNGGNIYYAASGKPAIRTEIYPNNTGYLRGDYNGMFNQLGSDQGLFMNVSKYNQSLFPAPANEYLLSGETPLVVYFPYLDSEPYTFLAGVGRSGGSLNVPKSGTLTTNVSYSFGMTSNFGGSTILYQDGVSVYNAATSGGSIVQANPQWLTIGGGELNSGTYISELISYNYNAEPFAATLNADMVAYY